MADTPKSPAKTKAEIDYEAESIDAAAERLEEQAAREDADPVLDSRAHSATFREARATGESYSESPEEVKQRRKRSLTMALALGAFIILVYLITMLKLAGNA